MANSYVITPGDGATTTFTVPFPYLDKAHVFAKVDGASASFTWNSSGIINITPAPASGAQVYIYRQTPRDTLWVELQNASVDNAEIRNLQARQALYVAQEAINQASLQGEAGAEAYAAEQHKLAAQAAAQDAADEVALAAASRAGAEAAELAAQGHKDTAGTHASNAAGSASTAQSEASTATTKAGEALASANAAAGSAGAASVSAAEAAAARDAAQEVLADVLASGRMIRTGSGAPDNSLGDDGDVYIDSTNFVFYAPKSGGVWPVGVSMVPVGNPGDMLKANYDTNDDGKVNAADTADSVPWSGITGVPMTFTPSAHTHTTNEVTEGSNLYYTGARVQTTLLTGFSVGANTPVDASDNILGAFQKLQGQVSARLSSSEANANTAYSAAMHDTIVRRTAFGDIGARHLYATYLWMQHSPADRNSDTRFLSGTDGWVYWNTGAGMRASLGLTGVAQMAEATSGEFRANTADRILSTDQVWGAAAVVTLTDAATIDLDMATFINASVTLGGNRTLANPSNGKIGQSGYLYFIQDATGNRTVTLPANIRVVGDTAFTLDGTANSISRAAYFMYSSTIMHISPPQKVS